MGEWFVSKVTGTIETLFWEVLGSVGALDSTIYVRIHNSRIGPTNPASTMTARTGSRRAKTGDTSSTRTISIRESQHFRRMHHLRALQPGRRRLPPDRSRNPRSPNLSGGILDTVSKCIRVGLTQSS
jgi:hypothetical protein